MKQDLNKIETVGLVKKEDGKYALIEERNMQRPDGEVEFLRTERIMSRRALVNLLNAKKRVIDLDKKNLSPSGLKSIRENLEKMIKTQKKALTEKRKEYKKIMEEWGGNKVFEEHRKELEEIRKKKGENEE